MLSTQAKEHVSEPEVRLRPPRTKSVAMSVCSSVDYEDEILDTNKPTNSTKRSECSEKLDASKSLNLTKHSDCSEIFDSSQPSYSTKRSDYPENLGASKSSNLTERSDHSEISTKPECPFSTNNALPNIPDMAVHSSAVFNSVLEEATKKVNQATNELMKQAAEQNITASDANVAVLHGEEVVSIDPGFPLSDLATSSSSSSSSSSTTDDSDDDFCKDYTDLAAAQIETPLSNSTVIQSEIQPVVNSKAEIKSANTSYNEIFTDHSTDAIKEITSRLASVSTLEKSLEEEKAKLKQQVDDYYASYGTSRLQTNKNDKNINPRCAANFPKANENKKSDSK